MVLSKTPPYFPVLNRHNPRPHLIMAPNLVDLINEYYEAKKPYNEMLREAHTTIPSQNPSPETNKLSPTKSNNKVQSQQEPQFSISPRIPNEEIANMLKKLEATKIEHMPGDGSTGEASAGRKGKAPVEKK